MATADRTYSFRAPSNLGDRVLAAQRQHARLVLEPGLARHISREVEIALLRQSRDTATGSHGAIMRSVVEAFVCAVERAVEDERVGPELNEFDHADVAGREERAAFLGSSAARVSE